MLPVAIVAGGKGTRIASIAKDRPKALIPILGKPFLDYQLRWLADDGVRRVVLCLGYGADEIESFVGDGSRWNLDLALSRDGDTSLGTGGALRAALPLLGESFIALYGDAVQQCAPSSVAAALRPSDLGVMSVYKNLDRWVPSNVRVRNDHVVAYDKAAPPGTMTHIDYGINVLRAGAFERFTGVAAFDIAEVHRAAIANGRLRAFPCEARWYEIGSPEGLSETEDFLRAQAATRRGT